MTTVLRLFVVLATIAMVGCNDIRPENLDKSQREAVSSRMQAQHSVTKPASSKDGAILRVVDRKNFFDNTTIISSLGSVKNERGDQQLGLMDGLVKKPMLNLSPGTYTVFVTCSFTGVYNNHLLRVDLSAGSDTTIFCMPRAGRKLLGLNTLSEFYVFLADSEKFEDAQAQARQEIEKGRGPISCGSNCQELPLD